MLRPRIIPCLLVQRGALVKTIKFGNPKYVGDPLNAVRLFNEKKADELIVLDIDATVQRRDPNFDLIEKLASECRMPLCYGGGVTRSEQVEQIVGLGVEKVAIGAALVRDRALLQDAVRRVGSQSMVAVIDVRRHGDGRYEAFIENGCKPTGLEPSVLARRVRGDGAGEIVLNAIDRDGTMQGYDWELVDLVRAAVDIPITVLGGAGSLQQIRELVARYGVIGAAAGSLFVFKGSYRAVLINYPRTEEKSSLWKLRELKGS